MKKPRLRGNFISEWFGQRIYPEVRLDSKTISGSNWGLCPFLSSIKRQQTSCIKAETAFGVCTINSVGGDTRKDWIVCPYRVIDSEIVNDSCILIFGVEPAVPPIPISILNQEKGIADLEKSLAQDGVAFIFFQDKLGGEISISGTPSSPEIAFDVTVVEISRVGSDAIKVNRYGFIEIQTMDFHGSYKAAVKNLSDAHRLHKKRFPAELAKNQAWACDRVEGPNIANVQADVLPNPAEIRAEQRGSSGRNDPRLASIRVGQLAAISGSSNHRAPIRLGISNRRRRS
jgi:hypothetical protein